MTSLHSNVDRVLSILIISYNTVDRLRQCLVSIAENPPSIDYEVIVYDNASVDGSAEMVNQEFPEVRLIQSATNDGYGVAINAGIREAKGDLFMFVNPDMEALPGAFDTMLQFLKEHPRAGVIGPRLLHGDGTPQASTGRKVSASRALLEASRLHLLLPANIRGRLLMGPYLSKPDTMKVDWLSGACHLIPRAVFQQVGPLTEETFCGFDDYDYCYRAWRSGYEVWLCSAATMKHHTSTAVRKRWTSWEVEQVATHNTYVVLSSHWPGWRVKMFSCAELIMHGSELLRHSVRPRLNMDQSNESYSQRVRRRMRLTWSLLLGHQQPLRRFQANGGAMDIGAAESTSVSASASE